jgi:two-component system cell cycle sensor histidine kinase/response regulator CckA
MGNFRTRVAVLEANQIAAGAQSGLPRLAGVDIVLHCQRPADWESSCRGVVFDVLLIDCSVSPRQHLTDVMQTLQLSASIPVVGVVAATLDPTDAGQSATDPTLQAEHLVVAAPISERELGLCLALAVSNHAFRSEHDFAMHIVGRIAQGISVTTATGEFEFVNRAYADMFGWTPENLIGKKAEFVTAPAHRMAQSEQRELRRAGKATTYESVLQRRDGTEVVVSITATPRFIDGVFAGSIAIITDLSDRIALESLAQTERDFAYRVVSRMGQGVALSDADGIMKYANPAFAALAGRPAEEMVGKPAADLFVPGDRLAQAEQGAKRARGESSTYVASFLRPDGSTVPVSINASPMVVSGRFDGSFAVVDDLTERLRLDAELRKQRDFANQILDTVGQGIAVTSVEGVIEYVNPALAQMFGVALDEPIGVASEALFVADDQGQLAKQRELRRAGKTSTYETRLKRRNGKVLWVSITSAPRIIDGEFTGVISVISDLSARRAAEVAMAESERRYRELVEWSPLPALVHRHGRLIYANPAFVELVQASSLEEALRPSLLDYVHEDDQPLAALRMQATTAGAQSAPLVEMRGVRANGTDMFVETQGTAITFDGEPAVLVVVRDITQRKLAEAERASLEAQLRESQKMQAIGTLAGGIAHDFNNILAIILGNLEIVSQDLAKDAREQESLTEIRKAATRARGLVSQILSFSRREAILRKRISLEPVVREVARLLRATLPRRLALEVRVSPDVPEVLADATQMQQILLNFCTNSMQAIPAGSGKITISLDWVLVDDALSARLVGLQKFSAQAQPRMVRLAVTDDGPGMPKEIIERIFEPFFTTKPVDEGTGLGLSVVHGIVEAHEGAVTCDSELGAGTTFSVYLPQAVLKPVGDDSTKPTEPPAAGQLKPAIPNAAVPTSGLRLMYIDDDESLVSLMERLLSRRGFQVSGFTDQVAALQLLCDEPAAFDVLITDYNMPGMTGLDLARTVRTRVPDLPIAIASGFINEQLREQATAAGVSQIIFKATAVDDLCETFTQTINVLAKRS